jgi:hypothetical protein
MDKYVCATHNRRLALHMRQAKCPVDGCMDKWLSTKECEWLKASERPFEITAGQGRPLRNRLIPMHDTPIGNWLRELGQRALLLEGGRNYWHVFGGQVPLSVLEHGNPHAKALAESLTEAQAARALVWASTMVGPCVEAADEPFGYGDDLVSAGIAVDTGSAGNPVRLRLIASFDHQPTEEEVLNVKTSVLAEAIQSSLEG